jgi:ketosteroid isomerase-like protein
VNTTHDQIETLERQRLAAIGSGDAQAMEPLLADDYVHVNSTGRVIDKAAFLKSMAGRARETTRGPLTINVYGDTAVILGEQTNRTEKADKSVTTTAYVATQIARRTQGRWQLVLMQLTQKAAD